MGKPRFAWPRRPRTVLCAADPEDLLARARTHEAVAGHLADRAARLDPSGSSAALRPLRRMVRDHRIKALLLRGQAAGDGAGIDLGAPY